MRANDAVRQIMNERGVSQTALAEAIGKSTQSAVGNALANKKGLHSATLVEMASALGYELVLREKLNKKNEVIIDE